MPKIDTKELEALRAKAEETEVEMEKVKLGKLQTTFGFIKEFKWLLMGGGTMYILSRIGALPSSFQEIVDALKALVPSIGG